MYVDDMEGDGINILIRTHKHTPGEIMTGDLRVGKF